MVVLDDGFQRRKLGRDLDVVVVDSETLAAGPIRYLPAGPFRERLEELHRADAIVVTRRSADEAAANEVADRIRSRYPRADVSRCALRPGDLVAVNRAAEAVTSPAPTVGVAAVMKAELALSQMRDRYPSIVHRHPFPDHARLDPHVVDELTGEANSAGIVGTLKDLTKLEAQVGETTPLWYMADELTWETQPSALRDLARAVATGADNPTRTDDPVPGAD